MSVHEVGNVAMSFLLTVSAYAANPFLDAKIFQSTKFHSRHESLRDALPRCRGARSSKSHLSI
jgi:hypothetical protein